MTSTTAGVSYADVERARERIADLVDPSPVIRSPELSDRLGVPVWLKLESLQPPGSFKVRGAASKILALTQEQRSGGVIACSGGNHGASVAYIARRLGIPATICVPETVDPVKLRSIQASGAEAIVEGPTYDDAAEVAQRIERERGLSFVHPFDDPDVIAGQGTIGLELAEQVPGLAVAVAAVSGGGLIGGLGIALKGIALKGTALGGPAPVRVIGASAQNAAAMVASLRAGHPVDIPYQDTLAEVLGGGIGLDNRWSMAAVRDFVDEHVLVGEAEIAEAMLFLLGTHRLVAEGGGSVGVAAALAGRLTGLTGPLAIVVSGGNADPATILALRTS
ncbi:MAG TPA: pyridoxal-phosphate dependent enzyme [Streptosporangiaceae bacterium]|jgi:threonine dehydratase|nr:pyridoxal-phosphate dependent enzyme [Streptosporangiaceae bacterium]